MIKAKGWKGNDLKGIWEVTIKIDGVRVIVEDGVARSRRDKPLYNIPALPDGDYEAFTGDFKETIEITRSSKSERRKLEPRELYSLSPVDPRLWWGEVEYPTADDITGLMAQANDNGYEGLILRQGDTWLKVKPSPTADVFVTGFQAGTGKHEGRLGALLTNYGKVGTGFKDADRIMFQAMYDAGTLNGTLIEVEYMCLTTDDKFRHPRFVRIRTDKNEESLS